MEERHITNNKHILSLQLGFLQNTPEELLANTSRGTVTTLLTSELAKEITSNKHAVSSAPHHDGKAYDPAVHDGIEKCDHCILDASNVCVKHTHRHR